MHFCRVHLIFFRSCWLRRAPSRAKRGGGKEAHDRHASPSVRTCFLLPLLLLQRASEGPRRTISWESGRARRTKEEEPDRGGRREGEGGKEERGRKRGRLTCNTEAGETQNLTVQGTGASDDGSREFVLVPPSRNFVPYSFLFSLLLLLPSFFSFFRRSVAALALASSCVK